MEKEQDQRLSSMLRDTASGDAQAFKRLYDETSPQLYAIARQMMQAEAAADDVLQDAFVQVWHRAGDYHSARGTVMAWLTTIVRYRAIDMLRKNRSDVSLDPQVIESTTQRLGSSDDDESSGAQSEPMSAAMAGEDVSYLRLCLARLSGSQKQTVALAFFHGMTHQEMSECLTMPLGTVKSRIRRGLTRLKDCLAKLGYTNEIPTGTD